jgi:DNA repair exonuclease SbcCD ATPase subunit
VRFRGSQIELAATIVATVGAVATKHDLDDAVATLRGELASKQDLDDSVTTLRGELASKQELDQFRGEIRKDLERFATKQDLANELERYPTKQDLANELERFATKQDLAAMEHRLTLEIGKAMSTATGVMAEDFRRMATAIEEKYSDVPRDVAAVREDLDDHRSDLNLHVRPAVASPKRIIKPRSKKTR